MYQVIGEVKRADPSQYILASFLFFAEYAVN